MLIGCRQNTTAANGIDQFTFLFLLCARTCVLDLHLSSYYVLEHVYCAVMAMAPSPHIPF